LRQIKLFRTGERLHDDEENDNELFNEISDELFDDMLSYLATLDDK